MMNLKSFVLASVVCSSLFAQFKVEEAVKGKLVLKDTASKEFEIKDDSKLEISISAPKALDKLVLKKQYQVIIKSDNQEAVFDVEQKAITATNTSSLGLAGDIKTNGQELGIACLTETTVKNESALTFQKGKIACVKTKECKSSVLDKDKKFKLADTSICVGKKDVEISKENATLEEKITCRLYDDSNLEKTKIGAKISFTRTLADSKEKHVRASASSECK